MSSKHTILDLPKYIKHARQKAIAGDYVKSLEIYKKLLKIITEREDEFTILEKN